MRRREEIDSTGQDSFLDIVGNIVGILIILVLVIGVRVKNAPSAVVERLDQEEAELKKDLDTELAIRQEIFEVVEKYDDLSSVALLQEKQREALAYKRALLNRELREKEERLDSKSKVTLNQQIEISRAEKELEDLIAQQTILTESPAEAKQLESYPTPISKVVHGHEVHFQLKNGELTFVPLNQLVGMLKQEFQGNIQRMSSRRELTGHIGPVGGFRMQYTMERLDTSMRVYEQTGHGSSIVRVREFKLQPIAGLRGETLNEALAQNSELHQILSKENPGRTTVTIWTYPDSFKQFRAIKKHLFQLGYPTAGRPLPNGTPIAGSPNGSRSAAQ
jgi:hypothetical protein